MSTKFEAIYQAGVLRPLHPLELAEDERVTLELTAPDDGLDHQLVDRARREVAADIETMSWEEIQKVTSHDESSWAETIIALRADR